MHARLVDELGLRIVSGEYPVGTVLRAEEIVGTHGVSRSVAREAVRVLESLGLVTSVRSVGVRVRPRACWRLLDTTVIRWRLSTGDQPAQLRSLTELRCALEPEAAALAATYASDDAGAELVALAARMRAVGRSGDLEGFLLLDIRFHEMVLAASGNEMFAQFGDGIAEVLRGRTARGLMPSRPHEDALEAHSRVAEAILGRDADAARAAMRRIMDRALGEMDPIWADAPRSAREDVPSRSPRKA